MRHKLFIIIMSLCFIDIVLADRASIVDPSAKLIAQRQYYTEAKAALESAHIDRYKHLKTQLADYPLLPYLDYQELNQTLNHTSPQRVNNFLKQYEGTYLGQLLLKQWLKQLASQKRWNEYRSYYRTHPTQHSKSVTYQCLYLWSRFKTGDNSALAEVKPLWNVKVSQPKQCDPLFRQWKEANYLTPKLIWDRYRKALLAKNKKLSRYLKNLMPESSQSMAELFEQTLNNPAQLNNKALYKKPNTYLKDIVYYALLRHGASNPDETWKLWQSYQPKYNFPEQQQISIHYRLAKSYAYSSQHNHTKRLLDKLPSNKRINIVEISLRQLLKKQDWLNMLVWINKLPSKERQSDRWQYWQARANQSLDNSNSYQPIYKELAKRRSFYGFLSADHLGFPYSLQNSPTQVGQQTLLSLKKNPALIRAKELFFLNKLYDARQEWAYSTANLSKEERQGAALLAYEWGWHRKSIESMAAARSWNDLNIRFPIAHQDIIKQQAKQTNLPETLIYAIARQESAWESDAKSRAGAMGLMQLLPTTAKETASKAGILHKRKDLLKPKHNIALGSRYISELLQRFNNNRVPAIAAYNAGPHRVNQWLKKTGSQLPNDVWIEVIPFKETRRYVQNVLSYALIYSHRTGKKHPLLTQKESIKLL